MPRAVLVAVVLVLPTASCGADPTPPPRWYFSCGAPVCAGHQAHPGVPACSYQRPGDGCLPEGAACDLLDECDRLLVCATSDPTQGPGGCPISRARFKRDIAYLEAADLERLHGELRRFRLARYRYRAGRGDRIHLGFVIDDVGQSAAVDAGGERVDLYGYASMAVAALQVQAGQIEALQAEVRALRRELDVRATRPVR